MPLFKVIDSYIYSGAASGAPLSAGWLEDGEWRRERQAGRHRGILHLDQEGRRQQGAVQKG